MRLVVSECSNDTLVASLLIQSVATFDTLPMAPRILLVTTCRWFSATRIAMAFDRAGCTVEAVCPAGHPLLVTSANKRTYTYQPLAPLRSLRAAIRVSRPDFIVPCDDLAMRHLHRLYEAVSNADDDSSVTLRNLIQFSLGDPASYAITDSRDRFMALVYEEGVRAPETKTVYSVDEVKQWLSMFGFPAVLKADGTSGGEGVRVVHTMDEAIRAYEFLRVPLPGLVVAKRAIFDHDWTGVVPRLSGAERAVSIQSFVAGPDANMAIACWQGKILSSISVEVLQAWRPKGPATIVRVIENSEMYRAAEKLLRRLRFSGLCGVDFLIDRKNGDAHLIEMNPRATQTCTLPVGGNSDMVASLSSEIRGQPMRERQLSGIGETFALFPLAWHGDTSSDLFRYAHHDIPWKEPELVREGFEQRTRPSKERLKNLFLRFGLLQS
jgi:carbamoylphosphate synthase large subunit